MNQNETIAITSTPATTVRSDWTGARTGRTVVSVYGDFGAATKIALVYTPVGIDADDTVAPPSGATNQEYPIVKEVASGDTEKVFRVEGGEKQYMLAVIPTGNDGTTDLKVVFN